MGSLIELDGFAQPRLLARGSVTEPAPTSLSAYLRYGIELADAYLAAPAPFDGVMRPMAGIRANVSVPDGRTIIQQFAGAEGRTYLVPDQTDVISLSELRTGMGDEFFPGAVAHYWTSLAHYLNASTGEKLQLADLDANFPTWTTFELEPTQGRLVPVFARGVTPHSFQGQFSPAVLRALAIRALAPFGTVAPEAMAVVEADILAQSLPRAAGDTAVWVSEFPAGSQLVMRRLQLTHDDIVKAVREAAAHLEADLAARDETSGIPRVAFSRWAPWMMQKRLPNAWILEPKRGDFPATRERLRKAGIPLYFRYLPSLAFEVLGGTRERLPIIVTGDDVKAEEGKAYTFVGRVGDAEEFVVKAVETTIPLLLNGERYRKTEGGPITVATLVVPSELSLPLRVKVLFHVQLGRAPRLEFRSVDGDILIPSHWAEDVAGAFTPKTYVANWPAEDIYQVRRRLSQGACERLARNPAILDSLERALYSLRAYPLSPKALQSAADALRPAGKGSVDDYLFGYGVHIGHASPYEAGLRSRLTAIPHLRSFVEKVLTGRGSELWQKQALNLISRLYGALAWLDLEIDLDILLGDFKASRELYYHLFGRCNQDPVQARKLATMILTGSHPTEQKDQVWALSRNLLWHVDFADFAREVDVVGLLQKLVNFGINQLNGQLAEQQTAFLAIILLLTCAEFDHNLGRKNSREEAAIRRLLDAYRNRPVTMKAFSRIKQGMTLNQALQDIMDSVRFDSGQLQQALLEIG